MNMFTNVLIALMFGLIMAATIVMAAIVIVLLVYDVKEWRRNNGKRSDGVDPSGRHC